MTSRMQRAADLMYHLEHLDVWLVLRDGQLTFSLGRDAPPVTEGIARRVLELEPELRSIVGWEEPPRSLPGLRVGHLLQTSRRFLRLRKLLAPCRAAAEG